MKIPILHLSDGIHYFEERMNSESLNFSKQEIYPNPLTIEAEINKFEKNIQCRVHIATTAHHTCDRCLKEYEQPFQWKFDLLFHLGKDALQTDEEDVVHLTSETVEVNLNQWISEHLTLAVPMKMLCREDCQGICSGCGVDLNEASCRCTGQPVDPRWEKLRELLK